MEHDLNKVGEIQNELVNFKPIVEGKKIENDQDMETASNILKDVKGRIKKIEEMRKFFVEGFNREVKKINDRFREPRELAESIKYILEEKMKEYQRIVIQKQLEIENAKKEQLRLEAAAKEAEIQKLFSENKIGEAFNAKVEVERIKDEVMAPIEVSNKVEATRSKTSFRTVWRCEVIDADAVPSRYKVVDLKKLQEAVNFGSREIAGVRIYEDQILTSR